ncbi:hypothetical protein R3P38DRAFT_3183974 [Favolaschia claudopus]|uniref:Uncharacterized protein n=1 Tax=Favolaschia claudopus TaxID=2862362 RepID=A0AAW0CBD8_9AGAR
MTSSVLSPSTVLPHSQRLRLIRSIRKLGDLITESSQLVEAPLPPPRHTHGSSVSTQRADVEITSEEAACSPLDTPSPTSATTRSSFLSLRLPKSLIGDRSPLSPSFSFSLHSPSTPVVDPETLKERKLAKVTQTLGENVPPELVFPPSISLSKGRKRSSTMSTPEYSAVDKRTVSAAGAVVVGRRRHAREMSRATLKHAASSTSLRGAHLMDIEPFSVATLVPVSGSFPDNELGGDDSALETEAMHRKELGWSGEWSGTVRNMEDVVKGLRELRLR